MTLPLGKIIKGDALEVGTGMSGHQSARSQTVEWLTPWEVIAALGPFDLDPCASEARPWPTAAQHWTLADDGLSKDWEGLVWCNPPYGKQQWRWLQRLSAHGEGIALIFARTETVGFQDWVFPHASALLFLRGRLTFCRPDGSRAGGNGGAPSVLVAFGQRAVARLRRSGLRGWLLMPGMEL